MSFASKNDLTEKPIKFEKIADGAFAFTAQGDPNTGVVIGEESILVIDAQATPVMAKNVIEEIRKVSDKPIKYLVLSHYHAVRTLGASAFGVEEIIASEKTFEMLEERGMSDWISEFERFPRLFKGHESIPGLTWPSIRFEEKISLDLGNKWVEIMHVGEGHTRGDTIVWIPEDKVLFAGDLVESGATPYCGDAQLSKWSQTLEKIEALGPEILVPGRGEAVISSDACKKAIGDTRAYVEMLFNGAKSAVQTKKSLKEFHDQIYEEMKPIFGHWVIFEHCMCFNASRAYDEANGIDHPRIWTAERDMEMWEKLS